MTEIYLDENLSEYVVDALNSLNKGYFRDINVYFTKSKFGKGVADEQIIPAIGKAKGIPITRTPIFRGRNAIPTLRKVYARCFLPQTIKKNG